MPESDSSQQNLAQVRTHMERIEQLVRFQILANKENASAVVERLSSRAGAAETYLAIGAGDSPRTQDELATILGKSQPTVSRILKELYDSGLVIKVPSLANRQVLAYAWSDLEPLLGVSRIARRILAETPTAQENGGRRRTGDAREARPTRRDGEVQLSTDRSDTSNDDERDSPPTDR